MTSKRPWFIVLFVAITACGGGGGGVGNEAVILGVNQESPGGIWKGTLTSTVVPETESVLGVITESGEAWFVTGNGSQLSGSVFISGSVASGTLTGVTALGFSWLDGSTATDFTISGTVSERSTFTGDYTGGGDAGSFSLVYDPIYERESSASDVEGMWVVLDEFLNIFATFTVDANGAMSGNDVDGCVYSGSIAVLNPMFNVYEVIASVSNCLGESEVLNGEFDGIGVLSDEVLESGESDLLTVAVSNATVVISLVLSKL